MAETVGGLYMSLGLSLDQLETDFIAAEKTTRENINRLNRESNLIKLRADVEMGNLDATADAVQILTIKENALNEQMAIQRDKIKLAEAALAEMNQKHGETSAISQKAAAALERERLTLQRLASELQNVQNAKISSPDTKTDSSTQNTNKLLEHYQNLKGTVGGKIGKLAEEFNGLKSAAGSADGAITKSLEIIGRIPHPAGKAVAALATIPLAMHGIENSIIDLAKPAIAAGDSFYVMSRGMQMSIKDTAKLSMICKVTGIEISEVNSAMRRFSTQLNKAGDSDNAMLKMLRRYGAEVRDSSGKIKNEIELAGELGKALKRAQAEGNGAAFRDVVGGKFWSGDFVTFLEDFEGNVEQAKKVIKNGLSDPVRAHALQGELNTLEAQTGQLKSAFSNAFMPVAEVLIPKTTQRFGELTKLIAENKDGIKAVGEAAANVLDGLENVATKIGGALISGVGGIGDILSAKQKSVNERYLNDADIKSAEDLLKKELQNRYTYTERISIENNPALYQQTLDHYQPLFKALEDARKEAEKKAKEVVDAVNQNTYESFHALKGQNFVDPSEIKSAFEETKKLSDELYKLTHSDYDNKRLDVYRWQEELLKSESTTAEQREIIAQITAEKLEKIEQDHAKKMADENQKLSDELYKLTHTEYENKILDVERWKEQVLQAETTTAEQRVLIEQVAAEKIKKIYEENQRRVQEHLDSAASIEYGLTHSAFEKQLYEIERWKDAQLEKSKTAEETAAIIANAAAKEADAFQREMDRIQGRIESAQDKLFRLTHSQKDYDLYQAQKEYQQYIKDGVPEELARQVYDATVADIKYRAATDKGGSYTKSRNKTGGNPYIIEFGKQQQPSQQTNWATIDPRLLAADTLRQNNLQLAESTKNLTAAQNNLIQSTNQTAQGFEVIEGDKIVNSFNNSAQNVIDAQNNFAQAANESAQGFEVIEGDKIITSINNSAQNVIDAQNNLIAANKQAAQDALKTVPTIPKIEPPKIENANNFSVIQNKFSEMTAGIDKAMTDIRSKSETFLISMETISKNGESVSVSLQNTAAALDETNKKILEFFLPKYSADINSTSNYQQEKFTNFIPEINPTAQIQNSEINLEPLIIEVQSIRTGIEILSDTATKIYDLKNFPQEQTSLEENQNYNLSVEPLIVEVQAIRSHVEKFQPQQPNITIAPNISIDLGGAYVFDDAMKKTLTEDVTNEVVIAVKDAFQQAKDTTDYSYSN